MEHNQPDAGAQAQTNTSRESRLPWRREPKLTKSFNDLRNEDPQDLKGYKRYEKEKAKQERFQNKAALKRIQKEYKDAVKQLDKKDPEYAQKLAGIKREHEMMLDLEKIIKLEQAENRQLRGLEADFLIKDEKLRKDMTPGSKEYIRESERVYIPLGKSKRQAEALNDKRTRELGEKYPELLERVDLTGRKLLQQRNAIRQGQIISFDFNRVEIYNRHQALSEGDYVRMDSKTLAERQRQISELGGPPQKRPAAEIKREMTPSKTAQKLTGDPAKAAKAPEKSKDLRK